MSWIDHLKDWWWVVVTALGIIATLWRYSIKIHKATEALTAVAKHEDDIKKIKEQSDRIESDVSGLRTSLDDHILVQKKDMRVINEALIAILGNLHTDGTPADDVKIAQAKLMDNLMDK